MTEQNVKLFCTSTLDNGQIYLGWLNGYMEKPESGIRNPETEPDK